MPFITFPAVKGLGSAVGEDVKIEHGALAGIALSLIGQSPATPWIRSRAGILPDPAPVPGSSFHPSIGNYESYHFKEIGHLSYNGSGRTYDLPEQLQKDIQQLKRDHLHPETGK